MFYYFRLWREDGLDQRIQELLRCQVRERARRLEDPSLVILDTQSVRAAAGVPGGVVDRVIEHGRRVGRGFSNDPDQTVRATPLTQSSYSLQFVRGRVVVSHVFPYVPHRELRTTP